MRNSSSFLTMLVKAYVKMEIYQLRSIKEEVEALNQYSGFSLCYISPEFLIIHF